MGFFIISIYISASSNLIRSLVVEFQFKLKFSWVMVLGVFNTIEAFAITITLETAVQ